MAILVAPVCGSAEGRFECETIYQVEFTPHDDSSSAFPRFLNYKVAAVETEILRVLAKQQRIDALFQSVSLLIGATVHEKILCARVPMIITVKEYVSRVLSLAHHDFRCKVFRALLH